MTKEEFKIELNQLYFYNTNILQEIWFDPIEKFMKKHINDSYGGTKILNLVSSRGLKKNVTRTIILQICAEFFLNEEMLNAFYESLPQKDQVLIEKATWSELVDIEEIRKIFGKDTFELEGESQYYGSGYKVHFKGDLKKWRYLFSYKAIWQAKNEEDFIRKSQLHLSFPTLMRQTYATILPKPDGYYFKAIPRPKDAAVFNAEQSIFREIPLFITHYHQGNIRYTKKGYPNAASARKTGKTLHLTDFPGSGKEGLRTLMISGIFSDSFLLKSTSEATITILKRLFAQDFTGRPTSPYLLAHLKGTSSIENNDYNGKITEDLLEIFKELPLGEWVSYENLKKYTTTHFINLNAIRYYPELEKVSLSNDFKYQTIIGPNLINIINFPILAGHIFLMAALGLMELAIDTETHFKYSYYEGLKAFRLTELGAYILELKKEYEAPEADTVTKFSFEEHAPIIRVEGNLEIGYAMLDKFAVQVSENRYQFSPGKFLTDCRTIEDLEIKISAFKQTIGQKLPPFWNRYLNQLQENSQTIKKSKGLEIYKLPAKNKELHRLVAQDKILQNIIIKAEKFHILIEKKKAAAFIKRMKELGYLIK